MQEAAAVEIVANVAVAVVVIAVAIVIAVVVKARGVSIKHNFVRE